MPSSGALFLRVQSPASECTPAPALASAPELPPLHAREAPRQVGKRRIPARVAAAHGLHTYQSLCLFYCAHVHVSGQGHGQLIGGRQDGASWGILLMG